MRDHAKKLAKKVAGVVLIILGALGALVPIQLVPFFVLIFIGLALLEIQHPLIDKSREWYRARRERKMSRIEMAVTVAGSAVALVAIVSVARFSYTFFFNQKHTQPDTEALQGADTAIVLGASVADGAMSSILRTRQWVKD